MASNKPFILLILLFFLSVYVHGQQQVVYKKFRDTIPVKFDSLKAVVVTATMRPRMKGDTLEYNTENLQMRTNAVVEELLRRLPGLHIDPDGTISYNGEKIQHLLVDGEDIFGDQPTLITRTFDASKIALVQILDRKSDQAIFTGIDDGTRTKTLNLVLKENARNGYFGRMQISGNSDGDYTAGGAIAGFRDREQITVIGLASNTGVQTLSNNGGGFPAGINFLYSNADPLGASAGIGIPRSAAIAAHYANTWNGSEDHLTVNYQYAHSWTRPITSTQSFQALQDSVYGQQQQSQSINVEDQHTIRGTYDWKYSTRGALRINFHGYFLQFQNQFSATASSNFNDTLVNNSVRTIRDEIGRQNCGADISWRIQTGKSSDNVFSMNAGVGMIANTTDGYIYSLERFYEPNGDLENQDTVDQRQRITSHALTYSGTANYSAPLWKGALLGLSYGLSISGNNPFQAVYGPGGGEYQELIDSLSSDLNTKTVNQRWMVNLQGKTSRLSYTIGSDLFHYSYSQRDLIADSVFNLRYLNWEPKAVFNYTLNPAMGIKLDYNTTVQQPSIAELTPVKNNSNPLHITIGNPDLHPGTSRNLEVNFNWLKTAIIALGIKLTLNNSSISTRTTTDTLGRQVSQALNVNGGGIVQFNFSIDKRFVDIDWSFHADNAYSRTVNYINADLSRNDVFTPGCGISASKYVSNKYSFQIGTDFAYFDSRSSINSTAPVQYWTQNYSARASIDLTPNFEIGTSATYNWQQKTNTFASGISVLIWNAYMSRNLFQDKVSFSFSINNMLNENSGISRTNAANVNTESSTNILGRYWMISVGYHFDRKLKKRIS